MARIVLRGSRMVKMGQIVPGRWLVLGFVLCAAIACSDDNERTSADAQFALARFSSEAWAP